jgi:ferredoxin
MKIRIDRQRCAGCSLCEETIPSLFYIDGYHSAVRENYESLLKNNEILRRQLADLAETCPLQAIVLETEASDEADELEELDELDELDELQRDDSFSAQRLHEIGKSR